MSTNFYWIKTPDLLPNHIGKRSAAGLYCYDCGTTLNWYGTTHVHDGGWHWHKQCPYCGKAVTTGACSFTWSMMNQRKCIENYANGEQHKIIVDEYERQYTAQEFLEEIKGCAIEQQCPGDWT